MLQTKLSNDLFREDVERPPIFRVVNDEVITTSDYSKFGKFSDFQTDTLLSSNVPMNGVKFDSKPSIDDVVDVDNTIDEFLNNQKKSN